MDVRVQVLAREKEASPSQTMAKSYARRSSTAFARPRARRMTLFELWIGKCLHGGFSIAVWGMDALIVLFIVDILF